VEVWYTLTLDEYVEFNLYAYRRSGADRRVRLLMWVILPLVITVSAVAVMMSEEADAVGTTIRTMVLFAAAAVYPFVHRAMIRRHVRAYANKLGTQGVTGPVKLILSEESLTEITEAARSEYRWADMKEIAEVSDRTYIFVTGLSAAILPRSGFENDKDYEAVRDFAMRKLADRVRM
jgi:hypothetical protein